MQKEVFIKNRKKEIRSLSIANWNDDWQSKRFGEKVEEEEEGKKTNRRKQEILNEKW